MTALPPMTDDEVHLLAAELLWWDPCMLPRRRVEATSRPGAASEGGADGVDGVLPRPLGR